jgi:putative spermidine/putrescine transport system ATP-binding protein
MNGGRLEQVDTPTAVYNRPQTLFVADFIGRMNLLEAPYRRDRQALQTEIGLLPAPERASWRDGAALVVAIRPEDLRLAQPDEALACRAQVEVVMDLGHYRQASLRISPGTTLTMIAGKGVDLRPGESVTVAPTRYLVYVQPTTAADEAPGARTVDSAPPEEVVLPAVQRLAL